MLAFHKSYFSWVTKSQQSLFVKSSPEELWNLLKEDKPRLKARNSTKPPIKKAEVPVLSQVITVITGQQIMFNQMLLVANF